MRDRNEWFKDVKRLIRGLEVETVENPFAWPTVTSVTDGEDVLHALGLHPSRVALTRRYDGEPIVRVELDTSVELDVSVNGSCGETVGADVTATAYIEDIKYCPFCGEELK